MNPRAPHYKFQASSVASSGGGSSSGMAGGNANGGGNDLESVIGSLRTTFVSASVPVDGSNTPATETPVHSRSLIRFEPQTSNHEEEQDLLERARNDLHGHNQLFMYTKLLRLSDQVGELLGQRATFEEKQAENDRLITDLRAEVSGLKNQVKSQHEKLEICKRLDNERVKQIHGLEERIKEIPGALEPRFRHLSTRMDKAEALVRSAEFKLEVRLKQQLTKLRGNDEGMSKSEQGVDDSGVKVQESIADLNSQVSNLQVRADKVEKTQQAYETYLKKVGETLIAQQNNLDENSSAISKIQTLNNTNTKSAHDQNQPAGGGLKIHPTTIAKLQAQVEHLTKEVEQKVSPAKSETSSLDDSERLLMQMDEIRDKIRELEKQQSSQSELQAAMDECSLANKVRLETMFYQLTKELLGKCEPGEVEFGWDEDRIFIYRQRVLERLAIEDSVQMEFLRLRESQLMPR